METMSAAIEMVRCAKDWPSDQMVTIGAGVEGLVRIELRVAGRLQSAMEIRPGDESASTASSTEKPKRTKVKEPAAVPTKPAKDDAPGRVIVDENGDDRFILDEPTDAEQKPAVPDPAPLAATEPAPPMPSEPAPLVAAPAPVPALAVVAPEPKPAVAEGKRYKISISLADWKRLDPNQRAKLKRSMRKASIEPIEVDDTIRTDSFAGNGPGVADLMTLLREFEIGPDSTKAA